MRLPYWDEDGQIVKDPDEQARRAVEDLLAEFARAGSGRVGVRWHTGAADELTVERDGPGRTPPEDLAIVRQYGATCRNVEIAKMLNVFAGRRGDCAGIATDLAEPTMHVGSLMEGVRSPAPVG